MANLSKILLINFYQNQSSIVEVMMKKFWCVFCASQCRNTRTELNVMVVLFWFDFSGKFLLLFMAVILSLLNVNGALWMMDANSLSYNSLS